MQRILVTGADGFVGRALSARLSALGYVVVRVVRETHDDAVGIGDVASFDRWPALLANIDSVVHLAARAHVVREPLADPLAEFRRVNVSGTLQLARAAAAAGVRRFVFLSSIGVNGSVTSDRAFSESDAPRPTEPYAISKWEAEQGLVEVGAQTGMEITRVRPPLVVGPGAKGNLRRLIKLVDSGIPLPFGQIRNRRSFVGRGDLCELLATCIAHERAGGELFLAANEEEWSTRDLLRAIAEGLERKPRLLSVPPLAVHWAASALGAKRQFVQLTSSLAVSPARAAAIVGWRAATELRVDIHAMAAAYRGQTSR